MSLTDISAILLPKAIDTAHIQDGRGIAAVNELLLLPLLLLLQQLGMSQIVG
jgi:hypothetical protein